MKLGCSINIFDGTELLPFSLRNLRPCVDYISVVYQDISNLGNSSKVEILPTLESLKGEGLINEIVKYHPLSKEGHLNEINKRNVGLETSKKAGMSHYMSMDCDEFYEAGQLNRVKEIIDEDGYDTTACQMQTYWKTAEWSLFPPESYFVPLISKIDERLFKLGIQWPVSADPTRKLEPKSFMVFTRNTIEMHHYSYVRKDIRAKLYNSSANKNWYDKIEKMAKYHDDWHPGQKAWLAGREDRYYDLKMTENIFGINI